MTDEIYSLSARLGQRLSARNAKVTTAESCTGGGIAHAITSVPGSSRWFDCGFVTYSNGAKHQLLGVDAEVLREYGAVSAEVVRAMAQGAAFAAAAEFAVAVSGIAGPSGGSPEKPVGTVWFGWCGSNGLSSACHHISGDREAVRDQAVVIALRGLLQVLEDTV